MTLHIYEDLEQGTEQWHAARRGIVTASVVGKLISIGSPGPLTVDCPTCGAIAPEWCISAARKAPTPIKTPHDARSAAASERPPVYSVANNDTARTVTAILASERIAGWTDETPMSFDMYRGVECEPIARDLYSRTYAEATEIGFMVRDDWGFPIGYSPDGLVGDDGLLEIKSPKTKTHVLTVLANEVPAYNMAQLQTGLLVSGREWIDFLPYVGGLPLWRKRIYPDPAWHEAIVAAVAKFEKTAAEMVAAYHQATEGLATTERVDFMNVELKLA